jgi:hypothetical protein
MAERKLTEAEKLAIRASDPSQITGEALAEQYGVSRALISKIRREGRQERAEAAKEVIQRRVEREMPNALEALGETLQVARSQMNAEKTPAWVRETRESAMALLKYLGLEGEKDPHADVTDEALLDELESRGLVRRV